MNSSDIFVSVIICTHRRPESLALLLESLTKQTWQGGSWELLVVENDTTPSEEVKKVIDKFSDDLPIIALYDEIPNLSRARNVGLREGHGEYVAYLDDDCVAEPGWLEALFIGCKEYSPHFCAGPIYPIFRKKKPYWYLEEWGYHSYYGDKIIDTKMMPVEEHIDHSNYNDNKANEIFITPAGGNFIGKRSLMQDLGGFQEQLGMAGKKIAYGEETALLKRAKEARGNITVIYLPNLAARHEVHPTKMTVKGFIAIAWARGRDDTTADMEMESLNSWCRIFKVIVNSSLRILISVPRIVLLAFTDLFRPGTSKCRIYIRNYIANRCVAALSSALFAAKFRLRGHH